MTLDNAKLPLFVASSADETLANYCYAVADTRLHTTRPLHYLAHHWLYQPPIAIPACPDNTHVADQATAVHAMRWLAGLDRKVECRYTPTGARLLVPDLAGFDLHRYPGVIRSLPEFTPTSGNSDLIEEVLLGPALLLQLAWRSVFALHAAAVEVNGAEVAFCAESGVGKSTLARACGTNGNAVADGILSVRLDPQPAALPCFAQLKWPATRQYGLTEPARLPLKAVCMLDPIADDASAPSHVEVLPLAMPESALALVRHTVANRLFSPELLQRQLEFCRDLAAVVAVLRLRYPRRMEMLPRLHASLRGL